MPRLLAAPFTNNTAIMFMASLLTRRQAARMASVSHAAAATGVDVSGQILTVRGQRVLLDSTLAALYGVPTKRLNEAVKRNTARFPRDFAFQLTREEQEILKSQNATSSSGHGGRRKPATAFTEHGSIMAANILNSPLAVEMSVHVVRAFVKLRQVLASSSGVARRLELLERSVALLDAQTRKEFVRVYKAILKLMGPASPEQ